MIEIITLDENGKPIGTYLPSFPITLPMTEDGLADRIFIRPDWHALNDPRFDARLRDWNEINNPAVHPYAT